MGYEIDFLPVGSEGDGGDAIAMRYGNLFGPRSEQTVIVVDGGYQDDGLAVVEHVNRFYDTNEVDFVVSTHPDQDHISGLEVVLEQMDVGTLLMHEPGNHDAFIWKGSAFEVKGPVLGEYLAKSLTQSRALYDLAIHEGIKVVEPFTGMATEDGVFRILGPTQEYYEALLKEMRGRDHLAGSLSAKEALSKAVSRPPVGSDREDHYLELLSERSVTTASNNSSVISMLEVDGQKILLTGDAGEEALRPVVAQLQQAGVAPGGLNFVQIPHHGSRKNVTPSLLNDLLGSITEHRRGVAFVSVPKKNPDFQFPSKQVTNAFVRRGFRVMATAGSAKRHHRNAPDRGWSRATPLPLYERVEVFDD